MAVFSWIWRGSLPALITQPRLDRELFYSSYVQTYLQRDVRELTQVADLRAFTRFLRTADLILKRRRSGALPRRRPPHGQRHGKQVGRKRRHLASAIQNDATLKSGGFCLFQMT